MDAQRLKSTNIKTKNSFKKLQFDFLPIKLIANNIKKVGRELQKVDDSMLS